MSDGINNRILIIKGILAEKCGLDPDLYDEIEAIFDEVLEAVKQLKEA